MLAGCIPFAVEAHITYTNCSGEPI